MKTSKFLTKKVRGVSLIETLLALSVGGVIMTGSVFGITEYSTGVKVQASASMLGRLTVAAEQYTQDNYTNLVANAPQELAVNVLDPYIGNNITSDAFKNNFVLTTRNYTITVPDPVNGGTMNENAVQLMVVAKMLDNGAGGIASDLNDDPLLRAEVANTTGASAGFITTASLTCLNAAGTANRVAGHICGAYGSFSFAPNQFPATDFSDAAYVALVGAGDQSIYGDQLYRYDLGDPDLNTMNTDMFMAGNNIVNPEEIQSVNRVTFAGTTRRIDTTGADALTIAPGGDLALAPGSNRVLLNDQGGANPPLIQGSANRLQLTGNSGWVTLGARTDDVNAGSTRQIGSSTLYSHAVNTDFARVNSINSLHETTDDALRIQNINNGETIFGKRVLYNPDNAGGRYEVADGDIRAQHAIVQDITCADCGGSLSELLPKWRHMGTYLVQDRPSAPTGTIIPKPACTQTKRNPIVRAAVGDNPQYNETATDPRFEQKIVLVPKQMAFRMINEEETILFNFYARNAGANWLAFPDVRSSSTGYSGGIAEALAMTYCVFTGGTRDPANTALPAFETGFVPGQWFRRD
jgi:type II secretory pathway pseudopilin PulG